MTGCPRAWSSALAARAIADLPLPGVPVIQIAQLMTAPPEAPAAVSGIERGPPAIGPREAEQRGPRGVGEVRVPARVPMTSARNAKKGRHHLQQLLVATPAEIGVEEAAEERDERLGHAPPRRAARLPQPEEEVVDAERAHVVGRLAPLAAAPVQRPRTRCLHETADSRDGSRRGLAGQPMVRARAGASATRPASCSSASQSAAGSSG